MLATVFLGMKEGTKPNAAAAYLLYRTKKVNLIEERRGDKWEVAGVSADRVSC